MIARPETITDKDKNVLWRAYLNAFDRSVGYSSIGEFNLGFPGQYFDSESGLYYNWYRYYDPETGRYITSDPIGLAGGMNTYAYVGGNPLSYVDPLGLSSLSFDRGAGTITLYSGGGHPIAQSSAYNNVTSTSNGIWPNGTYNFAYFKAHANIANVNGPYGSNGIFIFKVPGRTEMGVHSGRKIKGGPKAKTLGCTRTTDEFTDVLGNTHFGGDPLTTITIFN